MAPSKQRWWPKIKIVIQIHKHQKTKNLSMTSLKEQSMLCLTNNIRQLPPTIQEDLLDFSREKIKKEVADEYATERLATVGINNIPSLVAEITDDIIYCTENNACMTDFYKKYDFLEPWIVTIALQSAESVTLRIGITSYPHYNTTYDTDDNDDYDNVGYDSY